MTLLHLYNIESSKDCGLMSFVIKSVKRKFEEREF